MLADGKAPNLSLNLPGNPAYGERNAEGRFMLTFNGVANEPAISGNVYAGSGLVPTSVEVRVQGRDGLVLGDSWQRATVTPGASGQNSWSLNYLFPDGVGDPTDVYTVTLRVADAVGNRGEIATSMIIDGIGPEVALDQDSAPSVITDTLTISGRITDTRWQQLEHLTCGGDADHPCAGGQWHCDAPRFQQWWAVLLPG